MKLSLVVLSCTWMVNISLTELVWSCLVCVGRLAALWPLLGIVVEAVVLCVIIVVHERRRARDRALAAATDSDNDKDVTTSNRLQVILLCFSVTLCH